ncbi:MAG: hypothetical protein LBU80_07025 [Rikenellaceae bacterium]|jgi:hypothetical protein|nr:hypothetical protein [Rikenellaceae bacterium]
MGKCNLGIFFVLLSLIFTGSVQGQSLEWAPFYWQGDTISGKYIEKAYLYIPVKIDNLPINFSMQLDLGTGDTQFYGKPIKPYLEELPALADKLGSFEQYQNALFRNINLHIGPVDLIADVWHRYNFGEEIPRDSLYTKTPKHIGTIAPDLFQNKVLVIDYKACRLAILDNLPTEYADLPAVEFKITNGRIRFPFRIDGKECELMFDTGSSPFSLATSKERALEISDGMIVDSLTGPLWWGREITFYGLKINKPVELGGQVFENGTVYYDKEALWVEGVFEPLNIWGLAGNAYFFDNVVILDYKNRLFRIK